MCNNTTNDINSELDCLTVSDSSQVEPDDCVNILSFPATSLKIVTQNIRSVYKNFDDFVAFLKRLKFRCDVLILTECRLADHKPPPTLENYNLHYTSVNHNQNDGVVVYISDHLTCNIEQITLNEANGLFVRIDQDIGIICLYRSPSRYNIDPFLASLDIQLKRLADYETLIIMGDINVDIKLNNTDRRSEEYLNLLAENGLLPAHLFPTRESNCLDHVIVKTKLESQTLVIKTNITDHLPIIFNLNTMIIPKKPPKIISVINYDNSKDE